MRRCLELARRGAGHVSPNPMVGAVVVDEEGNVLGEGWHARYGEAHAEVHAIREAEARYGTDVLKKATLYVNLEPCSHFGKTPPCSDLILEKKIPRVVVGMRDPFPQVAGRGIKRLRAHGVEVTVGVLEEECGRLNEAFVHHIETGHPLVILKIAQTLDGRIATRTGDSKWISSPEARALVHRWRAEYDGVLVGTNTARRDDPALTVRLAEGRNPQRFVLDRTGRLPATLRLFTDEHVALTTVVTAPDTKLPYAEQLRQNGGRILRVPEKDGQLDLAALLEALGQAAGPWGRPLQTLLVEAGGALATAFLRERLADQLFLFVAPRLLGTGTDAFGDLGVEHMRDALSLTNTTWEPIGPDLLFRGNLR